MIIKNSLRIQNEILQNTIDDEFLIVALAF